MRVDKQKHVNGVLLEPRTGTDGPEMVESPQVWLDFSEILNDDGTNTTDGLAYFRETRESETS